MKIIFLDTETTGIKSARLIQLAYKVYGSNEIVCEYFKPPISIDIEAMSVHHITEKKVSDKKPFHQTNHFEDVQKLLKDSVLVAHNASFDMSVLENEGIKVDKYISSSGFKILCEND